MSYVPLKACNRRRRRGTTSPPLTCVESNPGPRKVGRRVAKAPNPERKPKLNLLQKGELRACFKLGMSDTAISKLLKISPRTVWYWRKRYAADPDMKRLPGTGKKNRKIKPETRHWLKLMALRNRKRTARDLAQQLGGVSSWTVSRVLTAEGLNARHARKKPLLSKKNQKARLAWAKEHKSWTLDDWQKVIWSDEASIHFYDTAGLQYVRRRPGEALLPQCVVPTLKKGGGKINIWGAFHLESVSPLREIVGIMDGTKFHNVLVKEAIPFMQEAIDEHTPLSHVERKKRKFEEKKEEKTEEKTVSHKKPKVTPWNYLESKAKEMGFSVMVWPSQSPDLNPIENLWPILKRGMRKRPRAPNAAALLENVKEEWSKIPSSMLKTLIESMPHRVQEVLAAKGGHTSY